MTGVTQTGTGVRPYFESTAPEQSVASDGADYASGLRDAEGAESGIRLTHSAASVEPVLLARARLRLVLDPEGLVHVEAMGLADSVVLAGKQEGHLPRATVRDLVRRATDPDSLSLEDEPLPALQLLRAQLSEALAMVDTAVARMTDDQSSIG